MSPLPAAARAPTGSRTTRSEPTVTRRIAALARGSADAPADRSLQLRAGCQLGGTACWSKALRGGQNPISEPTRRPEAVRVQAPLTNGVPRQGVRGRSLPE